MGRNTRKGTYPHPCLFDLLRTLCARVYCPYMNTFILVAGGLAIIIGVNVLADGRDAQINQAALAYEQCVQREYGMTPIQWYEQNQKYPLCGN